MAVNLFFFSSSHGFRPVLSLVDYQNYDVTATMEHFNVESRRLVASASLSTDAIYL